MEIPRLISAMRLFLITAPASNSSTLSVYCYHTERCAQAQEDCLDALCYIFVMALVNEIEAPLVYETGICVSGRVACCYLEVAGSSDDFRFHRSSILLQTPLLHFEQLLHLPVMFLLQQSQFLRPRTIFHPSRLLRSSPAHRAAIRLEVHPECVQSSTCYEYRPLCAPSVSNLFFEAASN